MTYSSRNFFISTGFFTVSLKEEGVRSSLVISSCSMISRACSTQFSQICPSWPAIRIFTSSRLRPQKEQCRGFLAMFISVWGLTQGEVQNYKSTPREADLFYNSMLIYCDREV